MLANLANCWLCIIGYIMHSTCLNAPFACRDYNKSKQYCNRALKSFQEQKVGYVAQDRCFHGFDCLVDSNDDGWCLLPDTASSAAKVCPGRRDRSAKKKET